MWTETWLGHVKPTLIEPADSAEKHQQKFIVLKNITLDIPIVYDFPLTKIKHPHIKNCDGWLIWCIVNLHVK